MTRVLSVVVLTAVLVLSGCADDEEPRAETTSSAPDNPCAKVTEDQLTEWAGSEQVMLEPSIRGALTDCGTQLSDDGMIIDWHLRPLIDSLETEGEAATLRGLEREPIELAGSTPGFLLTGAVVGPRVAEVVTVIGDRTLIVQATTGGLSEPTATPATLEAMARQIATAYVS